MNNLVTGNADAMVLAWQWPPGNLHVIPGLQHHAILPPPSTVPRHASWGEPQLRPSKISELHDAVADSVDYLEDRFPMTMTLLENAILSIRLGVEDFAMGTPERRLSAVRNLAAGVLLLFKEKLRLESPANSGDALIFMSYEPVRENGVVVLKGKGKRTVDRKEIEDRFQALGLQYNKASMDKLISIRNDAEHLGAATTQKNLEEAITHALTLTQNLMRQHLAIEPLATLGNTTWETMLAVQAVHKEERDQCVASFAGLTAVPALAATFLEAITCPTCMSDLVRAEAPGAFEDAQFKCGACGAAMSTRDAMESAAESVPGASEHEAIKDGVEPSVEACPVCGAHAFIVDQDECVACGEGRPYDFCQRCQADLSLDEQELGGLCSSCAHIRDRAMEDD